MLKESNMASMSYNRRLKQNSERNKFKKIIIKATNEKSMNYLSLDTFLNFSFDVSPASIRSPIISTLSPPLLPPNIKRQKSSFRFSSDPVLPLAS